jgi:hypothetical protein
MIQLAREFRMNIFKDFTLKWWQAGIFKIALLSLGIAIGSIWPELFKGWTPFLFVLRWEGSKPTGSVARKKHDSAQILFKWTRRDFHLPTMSFFGFLCFT